MDPGWFAYHRAAEGREGVAAGMYRFDTTLVTDGDAAATVRIDVWPVATDADKAAARRAVEAYAAATPAFAQRIGYVPPPPPPPADDGPADDDDGIVADYIRAGGAFGVWRYGRYLTQYEPRDMLRLIAGMRAVQPRAYPPSPAWPAGTDVPDDEVAAVFARAGIEPPRDPHLAGQVLLVAAAEALPPHYREQLVSPRDRDGAVAIAAPLCTRLLVMSDAGDALALHGPLVARDHAAAHGRLPGDANVDELAAHFALADDATPGLAEFTLAAFLALAGILAEQLVEYLGRAGRWRTAFTPAQKRRALHAAVRAVYRMTPQEAQRAWYRLD